MELPVSYAGIKTAGRGVLPVVFHFRSFFILLVFTVVSFSLVSCGYNLVGTGRTLPDSIHSVAIPILDNNTAEPNIEVTVSNILVNEFIVDGRLALNKPESADIVINGSVSGYRIRPVSFNSDGNADIYRLELEISADVTVSESKKHILRQTFKGQWDFNATSSDITITESRRVSAIKRAAKDAARKMISILIEGF